MINDMLRNWRKEHIVVLAFNPLSSCHKSYEIKFHPSPSLLSHGSFPIMHGEVVILHFKMSSISEHLHFGALGLPW